MTTKNGFLGGIIAGLIVTLVATGQIIFIPFTEGIRVFAFLVLFFIFLFGLAVTAYQSIKKESLFGTTADGAITGFIFVESIIVFLLYGRFF